MTGVELYIRDNDNYYCYKQRHDGYFIEDFVKGLGDEIFTMSAEEIIHSFHDQYFLKDSRYNFHSAGKPLEYGIKVSKSEVKIPNFENVTNDIETYVWKYYNGDDGNDEDQDYCCGYGDWMVYIDLVDRKIEGLEDEDESEDIEDEDDDGTYGYGGCGYSGGYGNRDNSFNDFLNGKFGKW